MLKMRLLWKNRREGGAVRIHGQFPSGTEAILMVNEQSHGWLKIRPIQGIKRRQGSGCPESGQHQKLLQKKNL